MEASKYNYKIFDAPNLASASQVAAGFINPVTGKWMTESWKIDTLMPKAKAFYQDIEQQIRNPHLSRFADTPLFYQRS